MVVQNMSGPEAMIKAFVEQFKEPIMLKEWMDDFLSSELYSLFLNHPKKVLMQYSQSKGCVEEACLANTGKPSSSLSESQVIVGVESTEDHISTYITKLGINFKSNQRYVLFRNVLTGKGLLMVFENDMLNIYNILSTYCKNIHNLRSFSKEKVMLLDSFFKKHVQVDKEVLLSTPAKALLFGSQESYQILKEEFLRNYFSFNNVDGNYFQQKIASGKVDHKVITLYEFDLCTEKAKSIYERYLAKVDQLTKIYKMMSNSPVILSHVNHEAYCYEDKIRHPQSFILYVINPVKSFFKRKNIEVVRSVMVKDVVVKYISEKMKQDVIMVYDGLEYKAKHLAVTESLYEKNNGSYLPSNRGEYFLETFDFDALMEQNQDKSKKKEQPKLQLMDFKFVYTKDKFKLSSSSLHKAKVEFKLFDEKQEKVYMNPMEIMLASLGLLPKEQVVKTHFDGYQAFHKDAPIIPSYMLLEIFDTTSFFSDGTTENFEYHILKCSAVLKKEAYFTAKSNTHKSNFGLDQEIDQSFFYFDDERKVKSFDVARMMSEGSKNIKIYNFSYNISFDAFAASLNYKANMTNDNGKVVYKEDDTSQMIDKALADCILLGYTKEDLEENLFRMACEACKNVEIRAELLNMYGDRVINTFKYHNKSSFHTLDKTEDGELFKLDMTESERTSHSRDLTRNTARGYIHLLQLICPSSGRKYSHIVVLPEDKKPTVRLAKAVMFNIKDESGYDVSVES